MLQYFDPSIHQAHDEKNEVRVNLQFNEHVDHLCKKIRCASGRIRSEASLFGWNDRKLLYHAWINGVIYSNGLGYLPHINKTLLSKLQTACNAGVRAVVSLPRRGQADLSKVRESLGVFEVAQIRDKILLTEAWKQRHELLKPVPPGPLTRNRKNRNLPLPDYRGKEGSKLSNIIIGYWNQLPLDLKTIENKNTALRRIRKLLI